MTNTYKFPFQFDPQPLQADLQTITSGAWAEHFNTHYFEGDWSGVALRSLGGDPTRLYSDPHTTGEVVNTPILDACPNIGKALGLFECEIRSARLLRLGPGSVIREHRDYDIGREAGEIRLHVPLLTNEKVEFYLDGQLVKMNEGECWYLDFSLPHHVANRGTTERIHLVLDCVLNDWLNSMLPEELSEPNHEVSCPSQLAAFRQHVTKNIELHEKLRTTDDRKSFANLVVKVGRECGFLFSREDVNHVIDEERTALRTTPWI